MIVKVPHRCVVRSRLVSTSGHRIFIILKGAAKKLQHGPTHEYTGLVLYELAFQYGERKSAIIRKAYLLQPSV